MIHVLLAALAVAVATAVVVVVAGALAVASLNDLKIQICIYKKIEVENKR